MKPRLLASLAIMFLLISAVAVHAQNKAPDGAILISQATVIGGLADDTSGFPITIARPGLYRLTGNIVVPDASTTAIVITASHVTLDLNGFAIIGPTRCLPDSSAEPVTSCSPTGGGNGVFAVIVGDVTVRNGVVTGMGNSGVVVSARGSLVERIHASHNGTFGISSSGGGLVLHNTAMNNGASGIATISAIVLGNVARFNGSAGIQDGGDNGHGQNNVSFNGSNTLTGANQTDGNVCANALCP